jgi:hypothetical protein
VGCAFLTLRFRAEIAGAPRGAPRWRSSHRACSLVSPCTSRRTSPQSPCFG